MDRVDIAASDRHSPADGADAAAPVRATADRPRLIHLALFCAAYAVTGGLGQGLALIPGVSITFWPPAGLFLATLLLNPVNRWSWYVAAGCLAELTCNAIWFHNPWPLPLVYYAANALEALTGAWLIGRLMTPPLRFETVEEVTGFVVLGGLITPLVGATVIALTDALIGKHAFWTAWQLVWLGDGSGLLVTTPLVCVLVQAWRERAGLSAARLFEAGALGGVLLGLGALAFQGYLPTAYVLIPVLMWAALRFQIRGAAVALATMVLLTAVFAVDRSGASAPDPALLRETVVGQQMFLGISAVASLFVAALAAQHRSALRAVRELNTVLEARVAARTRTLSEREGQLRLFIEHAPVAIAMFDRQMRYLAASRRWSSDYGLPGDPLLGRSHYEVLPDIPEHWKSVHERALEGVSLHAQADRLERADGRVQWVRWDALPWRNAQGEVGGILIATEDITERKHAEDQLRASEQRLQLALDASSAGTWSWDVVANRADWDDRFNALHGFDASQPRDFDHWFRQVHPDDRSRLRKRTAALIAPGGDDRWQEEFRVLHPERGLRWMLSMGHLQRDATGRAAFLVGINVDITERNQMHMERERYVARLEEAERRKDEFLAMLAHELRNPLAPIASAARLLERLDGEARQRELAAIIGRQTRHLARLVDDLLDVSRVTQGKVRLELGFVDIGECMHRAIEQVRPLIEEKQHVLDVSLPAPETLWVRGDATRLAQVIANLLNNAAKYTAAGGLLELSARPCGDQVAVRVRDNGVGLAPQLLDQVFDPFVQGEQHLARSQGGLGLGLALVRKLTELHGGTVQAHSEGNGKGSTFTLLLRRASPPEAAEAASPAAGRSRRILVIDDNQDAAHSTGMLLELGGHDVAYAYDGTGALDRAAEFAPEVLLLDIGLPGIDGYEVAAQLRKRTTGRSIVLIALTGYGQLEDKARARAAGFDHHLVKPVDHTQLAELIASLP